MNRTLSLILVCLLALFTCASLLLWRRAEARAGTYARELRTAESEVAEIQALKEGLEEANGDLQDQLADLRSAPPLFTLSDEDRTDLERPDAMVELEPQTAEDTAQPEAGPEDRDPTPEEIAEREEREERRREWRERRAERREQFRQRVTETAQIKRDFFAQISTEGLTEEYKQAHTDVLTSLDGIQNLLAEMANPELDRNERRGLMREMYQTSRKLQGLYDMQRDILLNDYAQQGLGLDAEATQEFIEYVRTVDEMTSMGRPSLGRSNDRSRSGDQ